MIDVQHQMKRGFLWFGSATAVARVCDLLSTFGVLAFLTRDEMGIAGFSWAIAVVVEAFNGLGVGNSLVQAKTLSRNEQDSLFWFATGLGLVMLALMAAFGPAVAWYCEQPVLAGMVAVSGAKLVFVSTALIPLQLLNRELKFKEISALQTLATFGEASTKVILAALGMGAWALVIANAMRGFYLLVATFWLSGWRPRLHYAFSEIRWHVAFGWRSASSGVLFQCYRNADVFVVERFLGMEALGLYRVATEVGMSALEAVLQVIKRVAYPVFARVAEDRAELKSAFLKMTRYLLYLSGIIAVFLCFGAEDLMAVVHPRWAAAAPVAQLLCFGGLLRGVSRLFPEMFTAAGKPSIALLDSVVSIVALFGVFIGAAIVFEEYQTLSIAWAWLVIYPILILLLILYTQWVMPLSICQYIRNAMGALGCMAAVAVTLALAKWLTLPAFNVTAIKPFVLYGVKQLPLAYAIARLVLFALLGVGVSLLYVHFALHLSPRDLLSKRSQTSKPVENQEDFKETPPNVGESD